MGNTETDKVLDLRGWACPWCILKAKSWLVRMAPGQVLEVWCTDPTVQENFPRVLARTTDRVIRWEQRDGHSAVLIRRGPESKGAEAGDVASSPAPNQPTPF